MPLSTAVTTRMEYQHKSLLEIIEGLTDEQIRRNVIPGKWSIFENIVHVAVYQHLFRERIKRIIHEDEPSFERYSPDGDPDFLDNCTKSTREIMQDLIMMRREIISFVFSLKEKDIAKKGRHPLYGSLTVAGWINFFLLHEAHHFFTIFKLAAELKKMQHT